MRLALLAAVVFGAASPLVAQNPTTLADTLLRTATADRLGWALQDQRRNPIGSDLTSRH